MQADPNFDREREIFLNALERSSAAERSAFPDGACAGDKALRLRLEDLLRNHANDSSGFGCEPDPSDCRLCARKPRDGHAIP
jgi:hypothetical protein